MSSRDDEARPTEQQRARWRRRLAELERAQTERKAREAEAPRDDEAAFEAAVDAAFQAALEEWKWGEGGLPTPWTEPQRDQIRDDLLRKRREAEEIHQLAEAERRRDDAERRIAAGEPAEAEEPERERRRGPKPHAITTGWPRDPLDKVVELRVTRAWGKHTIAAQDGIKGRVSERQVGYIIKRVDSRALIWDAENRRTRTGPGFELKPGPAAGTVVLVSR